MNQKMLRIKQIGEELGALIPEGCVQLKVVDGVVSLAVHRLADNAAGMRLTRDLGIEDRAKTVFDADSRAPWHTLDGKSEGVCVTVYCQQLPPTCKLVTEFKRVPKTEVRETGEFIEIPVTRAVCGEETI